MKKRSIIYCILTVIMMASLLAFTASAENTYEGLTYSIENEQVTITGVVSKNYSGTAIPSEIEGYPVTAIGERAFYGCYNLKSIDIPDSITSIGEYAFY